MSCHPSSGRTPDAVPTGKAATLADEGFRLFFPLAAVYTALFPLLWIWAWGLDLPLARTVPPSLWHAHEMIVGGFGAALIGFVTTAAPEWTDTEPPRGAPLWALACLWATGRIAGAVGWEGAGMIGAVADLAWMTALLIWLFVLSVRRRTDRLLAFAFWIALLIGCTGAGRVGFAVGDVALATAGVHAAGFAFLGLLGLALARITVPVTNLVLDPTERTSPFRPHPGRMHLAPGLVCLAMAGDAIGLSAAVTAYLFLAAGAAFVDRVAEAFIGRSALRAEIAMLAGASALAGAGLMLAGAARLGAPWSETAGLHVAFMGGVGLGLFAVMSIAGLLHTDRPLALGLGVRLAALLLVAATVLRVLPDFGFALPGPVHGMASAAWGGSLLIWVWAYWPKLTTPPKPIAHPAAQGPTEGANQPGRRALRQAAE
ncbi:MAG: NnrS family protein [Pseudomonadota bacterium]